MTEQEFWKKLAEYLESEDTNYVRCIGEGVLEMLSARLTYDEAEDLKSQLPMGLKMIWERREKEMNKWDSNEIISCRKRGSQCFRGASGRNQRRGSFRCRIAVAQTRQVSLGNSQAETRSKTQNDDIAGKQQFNKTESH